MENNKVEIVEIVDSNLNEIGDINGCLKTGGVWAAFDCTGKCWNVAETKNIANEMNDDINSMEFRYVEDSTWETAYNHFGEEMFKCPSPKKIAMYTWSNVSSKCENKTIFFVVFEIIPDVDDKDENNKIKSRRRSIEKYIAYKTNAAYWRDGRRFTDEGRMKTAVNKFITNFEKDKKNNEIVLKLENIPEKIQNESFEKRL